MQVRGAQALAMPDLQFSVLRSSGTRRFLRLRSLLALR